MSFYDNLERICREKGTTPKCNSRQKTWQIFFGPDLLAQRRQYAHNENNRRASGSSRRTAVRPAPDGRR